MAAGLSAWERHGDLAAGMGAHQTFAKPVDARLLMLLITRQLRLGGRNAALV